MLSEAAFIGCMLASYSGIFGAAYIDAIGGSYTVYLPAVFAAVIAAACIVAVGMLN